VVTIPEGTRKLTAFVFAFGCLTVLTAFDFIDGADYAQAAVWMTGLFFGGNGVEHFAKK